MFYMGLCTAAYHDWITNEEFGKEVTYCAQCGIYDFSESDYEPDPDDQRDAMLEWSRS
jgi:hypothetical protein